MKPKLGDIVKQAWFYDPYDTLGKKMIGGYNHYLIIEEFYRGYLTIHLESGRVMECSGELDEAEIVA